MICHTLTTLGWFIAKVICAIRYQLSADTIVGVPPLLLQSSATLLRYITYLNISYSFQLEYKLPIGRFLLALAEGLPWKFEGPISKKRDG